MNTTDNLYERIDAYLNGTLSGGERKAFEKNMAATPSLAEEVELQKHVHAFVLETSLADIHRQVGEDLSTQPAFPGKKIITTVVLCTLITGALYWWSPSNKEETSVVRSTSTIASPAQQGQAGDMKKTDAALSGQKKNTSFVLEQQSVNNTYLNPVSVESDEEIVQHEHVSTDTLHVPVALKQKQTNESAAPSTVSVPCPDIIFSVRTEASCRNSNTGRIQILLSGIHGGQAPYRYTINGESHSLLTDLGTGNYAVTVQDSRGCLSEQHVAVAEKNCTVFKDYSFNPETETWKFPFATMESGTISILDKSGEVVYKTAIVNGQPNEWNGKSLNGSSLEMGSYLYIATSADGESRQGYIILLH